MGHEIYLYLPALSSLAYLLTISSVVYSNLRERRRRECDHQRLMEEGRSLVERFEKLHNEESNIRRLEGSEVYRTSPDILGKN